MEKFTANMESKLVLLRTEVGVTQKELAEALGVSIQAVSNWENGRTQPRLYVWQTKKLCALLGKAIEELPDDWTNSDD